MNCRFSSIKLIINYGNYFFFNNFLSSCKKQNAQFQLKEMKELKKEKKNIHDKFDNQIQYILETEGNKDNIFGHDVKGKQMQRFAEIWNWLK